MIKNLKLQSDSLLNDLFESSISLKKWKILNFMRNSTKISTEIFRLRDSFGNYVSEDFKMANLQNYKFSRLGEFCKKDY